MCKKFSKNCPSGQQSTPGESSHSQEASSHYHIGALASQSGHVHSQTVGLQTPLAQQDATSISEQAPISLHIPGSTSSVVSVGGSRRGRGPSKVTRRVRYRPRRIRCSGRGQTLRSWYRPSGGTSHSNTAYQYLLEEQFRQKFEIERLKKMVEEQKQRLEAQNARMEAQLAAMKTELLQEMDQRMRELFATQMLKRGTHAMSVEDDGEDEAFFGEDE